jgi:transposase-like protein
MLSGIRNKTELYSCHEYNEKKRCPQCGALETKKAGFIYSRIKSNRGMVKRKSQRFFCHECRTSFTDAGYNVRKKVSDQLKQSSVIDYVTTKASLSEIGRRYSLSKTSILNWLPDEALKHPELAQRRQGITWSGYLQIDGKEIRIRKRKRVILTASDSLNGEPICYGVYDKEDSECSKKFLVMAKEIYPVPVIGVTSDFGRGKCFVGVVEEIFPQATHQICLVHYDRYVWLFLPRTRRSRYFWRNQILKWFIRKILKAPTREESAYWLDEFQKRRSFFKADYQRRFVRSIIKNYWYLTAHFDDPKLVKYSNVAENLNRQLERKLKNLDGFKTDKSLGSFLRIWFHFYTKQTQLS